MYEIKFTLNDIRDKEKLNLAIDLETQNIFDSNFASKKRERKEILESVIQGKAAEFYLIENFNFSESPFKYHDLIDQFGFIWEVKTFKNIKDQFDLSVRRTIREIENSNWNSSRWLILFSVKNKIFTLIDIIELKNFEKRKNINLIKKNNL